MCICCYNAALVTLYCLVSVSPEAFNFVTDLFLQDWESNPGFHTSKADSQLLKYTHQLPKHYFEGGSDMLIHLLIA